MIQNTTNISSSRDNPITIAVHGFHTKDVVLIFFYSLMIPLGVIGNGLTIKYFFFTSKWKCSGTKLLVILAANDLFASLYVPLESIHFLVQYALSSSGATWTLGEALCYLTIGVADMLFGVTSWLLVAIAAERSR